MISLTNRSAIVLACSLILFSTATFPTFAKGPQVAKQGKKDNKKTNTRSSQQSEDKDAGLGKLHKTKNKFTVWADEGNSTVSRLKEAMMIKLASDINSHGWTQAKTAEVLGVNQSRVSDLMRGQQHKFSIDMLVYWFVKLGQPVEVLVEGKNLLAVDLKQNAIAEIEYYSKAILADPDDFGHYTNRAFAYLDNGQSDLALKDIEKCIELEPERPGPKFNKAQIHFRTDKFKECIEDCDVLIAQHPDYFGGWETRGEAYLKLGEKEKALSDYNKSIEIDPEVPSNCYIKRALLYKEMGKLDLAKADLLKKCQLQPQNKQAQKLLEELNKTQS